MTTRTTPPTAPFVFLSEPIDLAAGPSRAGAAIARDLGDMGLTVYRPATCWKGGQHNPLIVEHLNRQALAKADCVVVVANTGCPSIGVWMEVEYAASHDVPVVVLWADSQPRSVSLQATPGVHWTDNTVEAVSTAQAQAVRHWNRPRPSGSDHLLKVVLTHADEYGILDDPEPEKAYDDDAGYDLITSVTTVIPPHTFADVPSTVAGIEPPTGTWGFIVGRSSTLRKRGLLVNAGVIDYGWRGPLFAGVFNLTDSPVIVNKGERLAQYILIPTVRAELVPVDQAGLGHHPRGTNGFGSSGGHGQADAAQANPLRGETNLIREVNIAGLPTVQADTLGARIMANALDVHTNGS